MRLTWNGKVFICHCTFEDRLEPKKVGFLWHSERKLWYTRSHGIAAKLIQAADLSAKNELKRVEFTTESWLGPIPHPENVSPLPFQLDAVKFALERNRSYLALDPGLGKTICAALVANALREPVLYICPPFLLGNVEEELQKWVIKKPKIARMTKPGWEDAHIVLLPDSILQRDTVHEKIRDWSAHYRAQKGKPILFVDEAHRYKNNGAKRTKALFGKIFPHFDRVVFLSGTPMPNRPMELFPVLHHACPGLIDHMNRFTYGMKYCAGFQGPWGWDFSGSSNLMDLSSRIHGRFMCRMRKKDVLPQLPDKHEELVFMEGLLPPEITSLEQKVLKHHSPEDLMRGVIGEDHVSTYRRLLGEAKTPAAISYIKYCLESGEESLLVFALHRKVCAELEKGLAEFSPLVITGEVPKDERFKRVKEFQSNPNRRVMILNIAAGGVGFNLTKANRVIFVEYSWTPADNDQAIDRAHRIGQDEKVLAQYLVHRNSIDRSVMEVILKKKTITRHI